MIKVTSSLYRKWKKLSLQRTVVSNGFQAMYGSIKLSAANLKTLLPVLSECRRRAGDLAVTLRPT